MAKAKTPKTVITFLLDRTGSMESIKADTIGGFNTYIDTLKKDAGALIEFSFLQFDSVSIDKVHVGVPIKDVLHLTDATYQPRAWTPLIDAAFKAIKATEEALTRRDDKPQVIVAIQTDGHENSSKEHTWEELNALIKEKTAAGWQFVFMGAGLDAYEQGHKMGIATASTLSYAKNKSAEAFAEAAQSARSYTLGATADASFSVEAKLHAGDIYDPSLQAGSRWNSGLQDDGSNPHTTNTNVRRGAKIVDDFKL